jgi:hypothetical protein
MANPSLQVSAGFLIRSKSKFLVCHATKGPNKPPSRTDGSWTISKGKLYLL